MILFYIHIFLWEKKRKKEEKKMRRNQFKIKIRNTYRKKKSLRVEADFVVHVSVCRNVCCGLTGWQWAEQLMLLVRSRWNPLAGSRLRLHCLL